MTPEQAFTARQWHREGLLSWRIAELLDVDEPEVRRVLSGSDADEAPAFEVVDAVPLAPVQPPAEPRDPNAWPPPVDASTTWEKVRVPGSWGVGDTYVPVRWVMLWGQRVRINDRDQVWCHFCLKFKTTTELAHPHNSCPVGLPPRGGIVTIDPTVDDEPRYRPVGGPAAVDFLRVQW